MFYEFLTEDMDLLKVVELESSFNSNSYRGSRVYAVKEAKDYINLFSHFNPENLIENT